MSAAAILLALLAAPVPAGAAPAKPPPLKLLPLRVPGLVPLRAPKPTPAQRVMPGLY